MALSRERKAMLVAEACETLYERFKDYTEEEIDFIAGLGGAEGIFRVPVKRTGLISENALKEKEEKGITPTPEHYFGRKASALKIFDQLAKGKTVFRIYNIVLSRSRVHLVTSKENTDLKGAAGMNWRKAYAKYVSKLVPYEGRKIKKVDIDGKVFSSAKEVSYEYDIPIETVRQRIKSESKKWVDWNYA